MQSPSLRKEGYISQAQVTIILCTLRIHVRLFSFWPWWELCRVTSRSGAATGRALLKSLHTEAAIQCCCTLEKAALQGIAVEEEAEQPPAQFIIG